MIGGVGGEFGGAGIHALVHRDATPAHAMAALAHFVGWLPSSLAKRRSEKPLRFSLRIRPRKVGLAPGQRLFPLRTRSSICTRNQGRFASAREFLRTTCRRATHRPHTRCAPAPGCRSRLAHALAVGGLSSRPSTPGLQAAQSLLERLLEGAAHRHHFAHRFHLRGQAVVGLPEISRRRNAGSW